MVIKLSRLKIVQLLSKNKQSLSVATEAPYHYNKLKIQRDHANMTCLLIEN